MRNKKITKTSWPKHLVNSIDCRKKDLIIRIADWIKDKHEPAYDVEIYNKGIYDWNLSETFCTVSANRSKMEAKKMAIEFAQKRIAELL